MVGRRRMDDELADFVRWSSVGEERFGENALRNVEKKRKTELSTPSPVLAKMGK